MEMLAKSELVGIIRERYLGANKKEKTQILDELVAVTGHHRKHAVRLLFEPILVTTSKTIFVVRKIYNGFLGDTGYWLLRIPFNKRRLSIRCVP